MSVVTTSKDLALLQAQRDETIARLLQEAELRREREAEECEIRDAQLARELLEKEQRELMMYRRKEQVEIVVEQSRAKQRTEALRADEELARILAEEEQGDAQNSIDEDYLLALQLSEQSNNDHHYFDGHPQRVPRDEQRMQLVALQHYRSVHDKHCVRCLKSDQNHIIAVHKTHCDCRTHHLHDHQCCPINHYHSHECCRFMNPNYHH